MENGVSGQGFPATGAPKKPGSGICNQWARAGACPRQGQAGGCQYTHDPKDKGRVRVKAKAKAARMAEAKAKTTDHNHLGEMIGMMITKKRRQRPQLLAW